MSDSFTYRTDLFFLMVARQTLPVDFFDKERDHVLCIFCNAGRFSLTIDGTPYIVTPHQGIMCLPDTVLSDYMMSPDVQVDIFGYSWIALQHFEQVHKYVWDASQRIRENPVVTIEAQDERVLDAYASLMGERVLLGEVPFTREISANIFQACVFEFIRIFAQERNLAPVQAEDSSVRQGELILRRFLGLLSERGGRVRSVSEAAEAQNLSPKYFSAVIKKESGRGPLEWIHEYTTQAIIRQLTYSDKTVKEISADLGFPNLSFFGKFVRAHLGTSPTEYRRLHGNRRTEKPDRS